MPWHTSDVDEELPRLSQVFNVYLHYVGIYQDVVQKDEDKVIKVIGEDIIHHIHEL